MLRHLKAKQLQRSFHASRLLNIGEGENIFHTYKGQLGRLPVRLDESDEIFAGTTVDSRATVSTSERGPGRLVVLNNPRNLNRVDFGIAKTLLQQFKTYNINPWIPLITFYTSGSHTFSAGYDIQAIIRYIQQNDWTSVARTVKDFNKLTFYMATCDKPICTVVNGQMLGSGAALGAFSDYVLVNPGVTFASPEVSYGYIPDSGNLFLLSQMDKTFPGMGMFLALTGARLRGADLIHANIATHIGYPGAEHQILEFLAPIEGPVSKDRVHHAVMQVVESPKDIPTATFARDLVHFERCFSNKKSVEEIIEALQKEKTPWSERTLAALSKQSPTALKLAFRVMQEIISDNLPIDSVYNIGFRAGQHMMHHPDFKEGVRATFIESDAPKWSVEKLGQVDTEFIERCLEEPLTFEKHRTCDTQFPHDVWEEERVVQQFDKLLKQVGVTIKE
jgi:enoyl-CoA hydratase/carnithine racemase